MTRAPSAATPRTSILILLGLSIAFGLPEVVGLAGDLVCPMTAHFLVDTAGFLVAMLQS